jgi:hypothetical protein
MLALERLLLYYAWLVVGLLLLLIGVWLIHELLSHSVRVGEASLCVRILTSLCTGSARIRSKACSHRGPSLIRTIPYSWSFIPYTARQRPHRLSLRLKTSYCWPLVTLSRSARYARLDYFRRAMVKWVQLVDSVHRCRVAIVIVHVLYWTRGMSSYPSWSLLSDSFWRSPSRIGSDRPSTISGIGLLRPIMWPLCHHSRSILLWGNYSIFWLLRVDWLLLPIF